MTLVLCCKVTMEGVRLCHCLMPLCKFVTVCWEPLSEPKAAAEAVLFHERSVRLTFHLYRFMVARRR